ncbi:hypothetical protein M5D96_010631, partial [Drosophila gunungcola]
KSSKTSNRRAIKLTDRLENNLLVVSNIPRTLISSDCTEPFYLENTAILHQCHYK